MTVLAAAISSYTVSGLLASLVAIIHAATGGRLTYRALHTMTAWGACAIFAAALAQAS